MELGIVACEGRPAIRLAKEVLTLSEPVAQSLSRLPPQRVRLGVRPIDIAITQSADGASMVSSEVLVVEPSERTLVVTLRSDGIDFKLKTSTGRNIRPGDQVRVRFDLTKLHVFDPATGRTLRKSLPAANAGSS